MNAIIVKHFQIKTAENAEVESVCVCAVSSLCPVSFSLSATLRLLCTIFAVLVSPTNTGRESRKKVNQWINQSIGVGGKPQWIRRWSLAGELCDHFVRKVMEQFSVEMSLESCHNWNTSQFLLKTVRRIYPDVLSYCLRVWRAEWDGCTTNKLHCLKPFLGYNNLSGLSRQDAVILRRLCIGHTRLTHSWMNRKDPPQCPHCMWLHLQWSMFSSTAIIIEPQDRDSSTFLHSRNYSTRSASWFHLGCWIVPSHIN